jgi:hypothetical protein
MKFEHPFDGTCYELPDHSYFSTHYENYDEENHVKYNYTYTRQPVENSTTVYADSPCGYIVLRDDVEIVSVEHDGSVSVTWDAYRECPIK